MEEADLNVDAEGDEDVADELLKHSKDAILFTIDVSESMMTKLSSDKNHDLETYSPLEAALKCAYELMTQRMISNPNYLMGVLLYGVASVNIPVLEDSQKNLVDQGCFYLLDLDIPSAKDVKILKHLIDNGKAMRKFIQPSRTVISMANILFHANQAFSTKAANYASRRLFLITDRDSPHQGNKALDSAAMIRARDLYDIGVLIELFPIEGSYCAFDLSKFYNDIIYLPNPAGEGSVVPAPVAHALPQDGGANSLLESLLSSLNSKSTPKRALFANMPLEVCPGLRISVKGYAMFKRQEPRRTVLIWSKDDLAEVARVLPPSLEDSAGRPMANVLTKKAYKFGGEYVSLLPTEMTSIRRFSSPAVIILGFKSFKPTILPIWANIKHSTLLYPSEEGYIGSTRVFSSLRKGLVESKKMGVAWFIARNNAVPQIVAILPGQDNAYQRERQALPQGLWLVPIPYADDIRSYPDMTLLQAPDSLSDKMRNIIQQLQLPKAHYSLSKYSNPALQWHNEILQALALEEELPQRARDETKPKYKQIDKRSGSHIGSWLEELAKQHRIWLERQPQPESTSKRASRAEIVLEGRPKKRKLKP